MCPAQSKLLINYFLQLSRRFFFAEHVVRPWDLCRDLDPGIHTLELYSPKTHPLVISTVKSEEPREFRRGKEDRMCEAGCAERKNQRGRKRGERGRRKPTRTNRASLVYRNSFWNEIFMLRNQVDKWDKCNIEELISNRNWLHNKHPQCRKLHGKWLQAQAMSTTEASCAANKYIFESQNLSHQFNGTTIPAHICDDWKWD